MTNPALALLAARAERRQRMREAIAAGFEFKPWEKVRRTAVYFAAAKALGLPGERCQHDPALTLECQELVLAMFPGTRCMWSCKRAYFQHLAPRAPKDGA